MGGSGLLPAAAADQAQLLTRAQGAWRKEKVKTRTDDLQIAPAETPGSRRRVTKAQGTR